MKKIAFFTLCVVLLVSCVSKKQYNDMLTLAKTVARADSSKPVAYSFDTICTYAGPYRR